MVKVAAKNKLRLTDGYRWRHRRSGHVCDVRPENEPKGVAGGARGTSAAPAPSSTRCQMASEVALAGGRVRPQWLRRQEESP
jgi:hypothetical protein